MGDGAAGGVEQVHDPVEMPLVDDPAKVLGVLRAVAEPLLEERHHVGDEGVALVLGAEDVVRSDACLS